MRRTAKGKTVLTAGLAALVGVSSLGCKSMPSLAWWKTASKDAPATAVAQAPALPSDVALKTEGLAAAAPTAPVGGTAAPFKATTAASGVTPASYPNTGVPASYPTTSTPTMASAAPTNYPSTTSSTAPSQSTNASNLGSIAMPYNPNAVPPTAKVAAAPAAAPQPADRYATASTPSFSTTNNVSATSTGFGDGGSRYGASSTTTSTPAYSAPAPSFTPEPIQTGSTPMASPSSTPASAVGDRYAQAATTPAPTTPTQTPTTTASSSAPTTSSQPVAQTVTQTAATSDPYRPGGTSTYPGAKTSENQYEVATRPETTSSVPNLAVPSSTPSSTTTSPQAPRYW